MPRLGRRGIILSLFINALNIALYLIIFVAACLNIVEASVNFIILNAFAASFACLLVVSEIRLPQLTYEYFRFLCTYRGRGMTYLFFGCLVASRIPFNLYGGIIVVCMGLAFFMLSYVKLIPPLDGLILNYKKLDQWKEQKHFRVQLEAQRIFEQQLQQEQNLTRMIPMHHSNALTVHAHMAVGSPKQIRAFSAINADSTNASGIGAGVGTGASADAGDLKTMFSPPLSPRKSANYPLGPMQTPHQRSGDPDPMFPHHQPQSKRCESTANLETSDQQPRVPANQTCPSNEQGHSPYPDALSDGQMQLDKALPPIMVSEREGHLAFTHHGTFTLSPPPACRQSAISSEPGSPLQYLNVDDPTDKTPDPTPGDKAELSTEDGIVKSAPHPLDQNSQRQQTPDRQHQRQQRFGQQQFPIRTTNKPAPPHDPFRKSALSSASTASNALLSSMASDDVATTFNSNSIVKTGRAQYQPPEPSTNEYPMQQQQHHHHHVPSQYDPALRAAEGVVFLPPGERHPPMPLTATGQILSSIGGISGCYGIVGGIPRTATVTPTSFSQQSSARQYSRIQKNSTIQQVQLPNLNDTGTSDLGNPPSRLQQQQLVSSTTPARGGGIGGDSSSQRDATASPATFVPQQRPPTKEQEINKQYMPDIVLTLPTPAEIANASSRRDGYFAM